MAGRRTTMTNVGLAVVEVVETQGTITKAAVVDTIRVEDEVDIAEIAIITRTAMDRRMPITTRRILTWEDMVEAHTTWAMATEVDMATPVHPRVWTIMACSSSNREEEGMADSLTKTTMISKSPGSTSRVVGFSRSSSRICINNPWGCRAHPLIPIPEEPQAVGHPGSKIGVETGSRRARDIGHNVGQVFSLLLSTVAMIQ